MDIVILRGRSSYLEASYVFLLNKRSAADNERRNEKLEGHEEGLQ